MKKNLFFLALAMFTVGCNVFLLAGLLPQIGDTIGQSAAVTGQGLTIFSLTNLLSALLFSVIFANQPAKRIIQIALLVFILGNLLTVFSGNIVHFLLGRAIAGIGTGIFTPLCITIAVNLVKEAEKGRALSFVWGASSAGVVFGVPTALYLSSLLSWQLAIGFVILLALIGLIGFSMQKDHTTLPESLSLRARLRLMVDPRTLAVIGITSLTAAASLGLYSYVSLLQAGAANSLSLTLFVWGLGGFVGSSLVGTLVDRTKNPRLIMAFLLLGLMLSISAIPFTREIAIVGLIPFFVWGVCGWAVPTPQLKTLFELHENQGSILAAINSTSMGLGATLGTLLGGLIITSGFNQSQLPFPSAILLLIVLIGQLTLINNSSEVRLLAHE